MFRRIKYLPILLDIILHFGIKRNDALFTVLAENCSLSFSLCGNWFFTGIFRALFLQNFVNYSTREKNHKKLYLSFLIFLKLHFFYHDDSKKSGSQWCHIKCHFLSFTQLHPNYSISLQCCQLWTFFHYTMESANF